jgi:hypothetical protein
MGNTLCTFCFGDGNKVSLKLNVDEHLVGFFASEREESRGTVPEKGLAEAIQRASAS